jgi:DNA-binding response OmpR family regulator
MQKSTAFVVEDQLHLVTLYEDALRLVGFDVTTARNGLDALNQLEVADVPTMILLDVNIPGLSGKDLHKHIRSKDKFKGVPVLIATANSVAAASMQSELVENDTLMVKPIGMRDLQQFAKAAKAKMTQLQEDIDDAKPEAKDPREKGNIAQAVSASIQKAKVKGNEKPQQVAAVPKEDDGSLPSKASEIDLIPELTGKETPERNNYTPVIDRYATNEIKFDADSVSIKETDETQEAPLPADVKTELRHAQRDDSNHDETQEAVLPDDVKNKLDNNVDISKDDTIPNRKNIT